MINKILEMGGRAPIMLRLETGLPAGHLRLS